MLKNTQFPIQTLEVNGVGTIDTSVYGTGNGGDININVENNANSILGILERKAIANNNSNDIDASSDFGLDGMVSIFTPETNTLEGIRELPENVIVTEQTAASACSIDRHNVARNSFTIQGRGGIQQSPTAPLSSDTLFSLDNSQATKIQAIDTSKGKIIMARGVEVKPNGDIYLTAYPTGDRSSNTNSEYSNCDRHTIVN